MNSTTIKCYSRLHLLSSYSKQLHLGDLSGSQSWHFDFATGTLSFGNHYQWQTQLLGACGARRSGRTFAELRLYDCCDVAVNFAKL